MNNLVGSTPKTPIEIALGIDENGMTTARRLYAFLELAPQHYARWCKSNIVDNEFADENVDYFPFSINGECGGQATTDYKLTAHFAKKLSMKGNGAKAEQARDYFTTVEERAKEVAINRSQLSPQLQMLMGMVETQARQELEQKRQAEQISKLEENQKAITTAMQGRSEEEFSHWVNRCLSAIAESDNYHYIGSRQERHQAVRKESYERLNDKRPCRLKQRVEAEQGRAFRAGASTARVKAINKLYVIEHDKDLKPVYEAVIREMMIAYCVEVA